MHKSDEEDYFPETVVGEILFCAETYQALNVKHFVSLKI